MTLLTVPWNCEYVGREHKLVMKVDGPFADSEET